MDIIESLRDLLPDWLLIVDAAVIVILLVLLIIYLIVRGRFRKALDRAAQDQKKAKELKKLYSDNVFIRRSKTISKVSRKRGANLFNILMIGDLLIEKFNKRRSAALMKRILEFVPDKGLFSCFLRALEKKKLSKILQLWLDNSKDFLVMRRIALSGKGEDFNGVDALNMFNDRMDEIREMTGDPEWASRYFAIKMLIYDQDERSMRAVWDSFKDSHALVRKTVAREIDKHAHPYVAQTIVEDIDKENRKALYSELYNLTLNDPVFEVRSVAKERILKDFTDHYTMDIEKLDNCQVLHIIELLNSSSEDDKNIAIELLGGKDDELRLASARFLSASGDLSRLFAECYLNDKTQLDRNINLLRNACYVNVNDFLKDIRKTDNPGSILAASKLLLEFGGREEINVLSKKVFKLPAEVKKEPEYTEIYKNTLAAIKKYGNDEGIEILKQELFNVREDEDLLVLALDGIPGRADFILMPSLINFLKDPGFLLPDQLRAVLVMMPMSETLPEVMDILKKGRDAYSHPVRIQALKLLGEFKKDYCLQNILENLPVFRLEDAREFAKMLSAYAEKLFNERVEKILNSSDAHVRASVIASLPATGKQTFIKDIRSSLKDADPEVRIASIWALLEYQDTKQLNRSSDMLRDPVERVRIEVAKALGRYGSENTLEELKVLINDKNEADVVKIAAMTGLSYCERTTSVDILIDKLSRDEDLINETITALGRKSDKSSVARIIEHFKDAGPALRDHISAAFELMGPDGENSMVELLREDIPSLKPYISQVLESAGFVEATIRFLKHREPKMRKEAADMLSMIGTMSSFRGMVLAARDPDENVRISVTKALEALNTEEGADILKGLENDPDKKVRKYTLWALERVKAKAL